MAKAAGFYDNNSGNGQSDRSVLCMTFCQGLFQADSCRMAMNRGVLKGMPGGRLIIGRLSLPGQAATNGHPYQGGEVRLRWQSDLPVSVGGGPNALEEVPSSTLQETRRPLCLWCGSIRWVGVEPRQRGGGDKDIQGDQIRYPHHIRMLVS